MKKAVFFDIDGTLLDHFGGIVDITPNVKKAIRALQKEGRYVLYFDRKTICIFK